MASRRLLALAQAALLAHVVVADIYLFGARHEVPHFVYRWAGMEWSEEYPTCEGARQSPIHIPADEAFERVADGQQTVLDYGKLASNGSNVKVVNNGHTVQVVLPADFRPNVTVAVRGGPSAKLTAKLEGEVGAMRRVQVTPTQFHWHARSEHVIDGKEYPLELHIVNFVYNDTLPGCGAAGCATVVGVLFELAEDPDTAAAKNPFIDAVFTTMPHDEGESSFLPAGTVLDFDELLPADRSYVTFEGSLTTPPCTEGILWHVLVSPMKITRDQLHQFELAVGETDCLPPNATAEGSATTAAPNAAAAPPAAAAAKAAVSAGGAQAAPAAGAAEQRVGPSAGSIKRLVGAPTSTMHFSVPAYEADHHDGLKCRHFIGSNYREVQDRDNRTILFWADGGVCFDQLQQVANRSKALGTLLDPHHNAAKSLSLQQYGAIQEAQLTRAAGCAGMPDGRAVGAAAASSGARAVRTAWLLLAGALLAVGAAA